jgi:hypothetical protein
VGPGKGTVVIAFIEESAERVQLDLDECVLNAVVVMIDTAPPRDGWIDDEDVDKA